MQYRAIGLMSGSSLDGLDIVYAELDDSGGKWNYEIKAAACIAYTSEWQTKLQHAVSLNAYEFLLLHTAYGRWIGEQVNEFIAANHLHHKVQLIASHGHTVFHAPQLHMTAQLGDGATIAAVTGINTVSDLRSMDVALGGQGAPIVPMGEKLLLKDYTYCLNIGGIANISCNDSNGDIAFDVCPANRVLNMLSAREGKQFDDGGSMAREGAVNRALLTQLNNLDYYKQPYPKSLANDFGTHIIFPLIESFQLATADALRTYMEHITQQLVYAVNSLRQTSPAEQTSKLLVTGGGAFNTFLVERITDALKPFNIEVVIPNSDLINYKEALIMALLGVLRWREEDTVMNSVTGATRSSIGGAVWIGQEA
ncbi:MAG TPA: anhydro-N-acetylmuramic acid kinase [Panacibacter sp.]|nr:anhydro-N-acetylmuramic acid kinase [Panacibacter sp.]